MAVILPQTGRVNSRSADCHATISSAPTKAPYQSCEMTSMDIEAMIAVLGERFVPAGGSTAH